MKDIIEKLTEKIESLTSDAYFYDMQIKFLTGLKNTSPEVEKEMEGTTFDDLIEEDKILKEKILQKISTLNIEIKTLTNEKAS